MIGIDTNVIVRFLTLDPPEQAQRAREIIAGADVFVSVTVILETEWVLRDAYGLPRADVARELGRFCALERVTVGEAGAVRRALTWMEAGLDFADALHLALNDPSEAFVTFDKRLAKRAAQVAGVKARLAR